MCFKISTKKDHKPAGRGKRKVWAAFALLAVLFLLAACGEKEEKQEIFPVEPVALENSEEEEPGAGGWQDSGREPETGTEIGQESGTGSETEQESEAQRETGQKKDELNKDGAGEDEQQASADQEDPGPEITLVMVGDILLHTPVAESGKLEEGGYDFSAVFSEMREEIEAADIALVNQEVIIGGQELGISGYPAFNAPYELGDALADAGFDVVLHATNHALDKGKKGILNCLSFWQEDHPDIAVLGIHGSPEAQEEIYVYEQEGIRIAILNYTYGTNGIPLPEDMPYAVDMLERERVASDLARAKELADFAVVCPHWGTEYTLEATEAQKNWAQLFMENGADLVIGTHPHVIEPVEWLAEETLVYYSLGNFVNWTAGTGEGVANRMVGCMARITIGRDETGEAVIRSYEAVPLVCHVEKGFGGVRVYPLEEYTEELAGRNEIVGQDGNFSLEYCQELVRRVFGTEAH